MNFNVLVFPCGSEIGLEINQALRWINHIQLFGASSVISNHGKYVYDNYIDGLPLIDEDNFIDKLNEIIDKYEISFLFPAHDSVVKKLSMNHDKVHCNLITSTWETCCICRSKSQTYNLLQNKVKVPSSYSLENNNIVFPAFLKPDIGQGSKGTHFVNSFEEVEFYLNIDKTLLILEYLPGAEFTIDCFTDRHGVLRFVGGRERERITNGISTHSFPVSNKTFEEIAQNINCTMKFRGAWFFQLKKNINNELVLLEVAPRIAGTTCLYRNLGINLPLLSIYDAADLDVEFLCNNYNIEVDRALSNKFKLNLEYENVYIDFDDCILLKQNINIPVAAFLFQCINKNIKLNLITKHKGNLHLLLKKCRINDVFDSIIQLDETDYKWKYIQPHAAIFIDDSFKERREVKNNLRIPVFGLDSIECLLE